MHIMSYKSGSTLVTSLVCAFLAACGGGSGDSTTTRLSGASQAADTIPAPAATAAPVPASGPTADATQARFRGPQGIAVSATGDLYVADTQNYTIRKIARNGEVRTIAGMAGVAGSADGIGADARFTEPRNVAVDTAGNVYVTDGTAVRKITPAGQVTTMAGAQGQPGDSDGSAGAARFTLPRGIAVDLAGNVFVADSTFDGPYVIRRITPAGEVTTFAGGNASGVTEIPYDGTGTNARFAGPSGLAMDASGNLFVTDIVFGSFTGSKFYDGATYIRKVTPAAAVTTLAGNHGFTSLPAGGELAQFSRSTGIAVDGGGNIFVTDRFDGGNRILKLSAGGAVTAVPVDAANFGALSGLAYDGSGNLYASDMARHTISRIAPDGGHTLYAGRPDEAGSADTP